MSVTNTLREYQDLRLIEYFETYRIVSGKGKDNIVSPWFGDDEKEHLLNLSEPDFLENAEGYLMDTIGEWVQTDGSDSTLQFGRKVNAHTWQYREWVDLPVDHPEHCSISRPEKIARWDRDEWRQIEIDIRDYSEEDVIEAVIPFGYEVSRNSEDAILLRGYSLEESIQLMCECIFELD